MGIRANVAPAVDCVDLDGSVVVNLFDVLGGAARRIMPLASGTLTITMASGVSRTIDVVQYVPEDVQAIAITSTGVACRVYA